MLPLKTLAERPGFFPGVLSFCLPGLGQLYQRRWPAAAAGFVPFWALLAYRPGTALPLLLAVAFGAEAFYWATTHELNEGPTPKRRRYAYGATAVAAFCFWGMLVSPVALPLQRQALANRTAEGLAAFVKRCAKERHIRPASFAECGEPPARRDPWGGDFEIKATDRGFELRSPAADGKAGTADDFVYSYRLP
jgi:hypothetical protein